MLTGAVIAGATYAAIYIFGAMIGMRFDPATCLVEMACFVSIGAAIGWLV
jgi:hypothetical protein